MFVVASLMSSPGLAPAQSTWCDDFEDGVIDSNLWVWGGALRAAPSGNGWQWSHEEIIDTDGYLKMRVWGPTSGISHGAEAWVRTQYDYNDGLNYIINFRWGADVNDSHVDLYAVQIADGTIPGGTDPFWYGAGPGPIDGAGWKNLYFQSDQSDMLPTDWSIHIDGTNDTATLFSGPNLTRQLIAKKVLPGDQPWYVRIILSDATSSGFPAGDDLLNVYDFCSLETTIQAPSIPAVSEWGLIVMTLLVLTGGTIAMGRRYGRTRTRGFVNHEG